MARARLVQVIDASFEKDGRQIEFRKVRIRAEGREADAVDLVTVAAEGERPSVRRERKKTPKSRGTAEPAKVSQLRDVLKAWRSAEAKKKRIPAFRIMADRVMDNILDARPSDADELMSVSGVGPKLVEKHGPRSCKC